MSREGESSVSSVFATTMRNGFLLRLELAWAASDGAELAVWVCPLVYACSVGGANVSDRMPLAQLIPCIFVAPYLGTLADRRHPGRARLAQYLVQFLGTIGTGIRAVQREPAVRVLVGLLGAQHVLAWRRLMTAHTPCGTGGPDGLTSAP